MTFYTIEHEWLQIGENTDEGIISVNGGHNIYALSSVDLDTIYFYLTQTKAHTLIFTKISFKCFDLSAKISNILTSPDLRTLDFSGKVFFCSPLTPENMKTVAALLTNNSTITQLHLKCLESPKDTQLINSLVEMIKANQHLTTLYLVIKDDEPKAYRLLKAVLSNSKLEMVHLLGNFPKLPITSPWYTTPLICNFTELAQALDVELPANSQLKILQFTDRKLIAKDTITPEPLPADKASLEHLASGRNSSPPPEQRCGTPDLFD